MTGMHGETEKEQEGGEESEAWWCGWGVGGG